jgi:CBS domain containing-hemolysin-like protein
MCCLGIRPIGARQTTMRHLMGTMCVPSAHKEQLKDPQKLKPLKLKRSILAFISIKFGHVFVISMSTLNTPSTNPISVQHWYAAVTSCYRTILIPKRYTSINVKTKFDRNKCENGPF